MRLMSTITGIGKRLLLLTLLLADLFLISCKENQHQTAPSYQRPLVGVTTVHTENVMVAENFPAITTYLDTTDICAPISGYLINVNIRKGDRVNKGRVIAVLETKEHRAINLDTNLSTNEIKEYGVVKITSPAEGIIVDMAHQQGDYLMEGTPVCAFTKKTDFYLKVLIPHTYQSKIKPGDRLLVSFPDSATFPGFEGRIVQFLHDVDPVSQAEQVLVKPLTDVNLPANMNLQVKLVIQFQQDAQMVPKSTLLSNEKLTEFWVMQLINDSVAVRINVVPGIQTEDSIQIVKPVFPANTKLLTEGNYGLPDSVIVSIKK